MNADTIGLLPIFNLLAGRSYLDTLLICLTISPLMMIFVGLIGESRFIKLDPWHQFLSFFPGDLFLSWGVANGLFLSQRLTIKVSWYNNTLFHIGILLGAFFVAIMITRMELRADPDKPYAFPRRALTSPTKLYHNFALYGFYGYLATSTYVACIAGGMGWNTLYAALPFGGWIILLLTEGKSTKLTREQRIKCAHVEDWSPIWKNRSNN